MPTHPPLTADPVQALREATHHLHQRLDQGLPLARDQATLADYALHISVLRDWQMALAPWLARTGSDLSALALIEEDLADCGQSICDTAQVDVTAVHRADDGSDAFCWGMAYVLEGSRLGGQVLYRRLAPRLAPHPLRYLAQRARYGRPWAETLACLRRELDNTASRQGACSGAVVAFETLLQRFEVAGCRL